MAVRVHDRKPGPGIIFLLPVLLLALGILTGDASAARPPAATMASAAAPHGAPVPPPNDAYMTLVPQGSAPPGGGTVRTGDRFVLELWLNAGSHTDATAQQSYLTFPYDLIKNARVDQITTTCSLSDQFTPDTTTFDAVLQNEVCNGPSWCNRIAPPGTMSYASGTFNQSGVGGYFRAAQIGLCAIAPGQATLHW